ncbi:MAG: hypothetical protein AAGJ40_02880 [Planctomycetota bacterium]
MPLFLEPDQTFDVWLDSDQHKPIESRPVFVAKSQSMRGQQRIATVLDRMYQDEDSPSPEQLFCDAQDVLADALTGWRNMGDVKYPTDVREFLTYQEARELMGKIMFNQHVSAEEKKS